MNKKTKDDVLNKQVFSSDDRRKPPTTELLQQRILDETRLMEQQSPLRSVAKQTQRHWFTAWVLVTSSVAVLMLSTAVLFNGFPPSQPEVGEVSGSEIRLPISDELAWQDVMLMHDELAFLGL